MDGIKERGASGSSCIIVGGFKSSLSRDTLEYYFENSRRSGGGDIKEIIFDRDRAVAQITFVDPQVADRVCRQTHQLENCSLLVSKKDSTPDNVFQPDPKTYHNDFESGRTGQTCGYPPQAGNYPRGDRWGSGSGVPREPGVQMDSPHQDSIRLAPALGRIHDVTIDLNKYKLRFIIRDPKRKQPIENQLRDMGFVIEWPRHDSDGFLVLRNISSDFSFSQMSGSASAVQKVNDYFSDVTFVQTFSVSSETWKQTMQAMGSLDVKNADCVEVFVEDPNITIVGYRAIAMEAADRIQKIISDAERRISAEREIVKDFCAHLKPFQLKILSSIDFPRKVSERYRGLRVAINMASSEVIFEGHSMDVRLAQGDLKKIVSDITTLPVSPKLSSNQIEFLRRQPVTDYVFEQMSRRDLCRFWEVVNGDVVVHQMSLPKCREAADVIFRSLARVLIPVERQNESLLASRDWERKCHDIEEQHGGRVQIITDTQCEGLCILATDDLSGRVEMLIKDFLRVSSPQDERIAVDPLLMTFLRFHCSRDLVKLTGELKQLNVSLEHNETGFTLKGTNSDLRIGSDKTRKLVTKICQRKHFLKDHAMKRYIKSTKGRDYLSALEHANTCMIRIIDGGMTESSGWSGQNHVTRQHMTCTAPGGQNISVVYADVTGIQTEALVNAANKYLQHSGGLAAAIVQRGGLTIQRECDDFIKENGSIFDGDIFCSNPGSLPFRVIIHAVGPVWTNGNDGEKFRLKAVTLKCLNECSRRRLRSVAIPAISAGIFGFPQKLATQIIVDAVQDYLRNDRDSVIREVVLFGNDDGIVKDFGAAVQSSFQGIRFGSDMTGSSSMTSNSSVSPPFGGLSVRVITGELAKQRVDALVCVTTSSLKLNSGALSASLLNLGGNGLQDECSRKHQNGVKPGEVAVTTGGFLDCKNVLWGTLLAWDGGAGQSSKFLGKFLHNCLNDADRMGARSIAIPAMGTGRLGYARDIVARITFDAVAEFSKRNPGSLREVRIIVYHQDNPTIKAFHHEEQKWLDGSRQTHARHGDGADHSRDSTHGRVTRNRDTFSFGKVNLVVKEGDISAEACDGIVNGVTKEVDFNKGAVTAMIMKKGGPQLQRDCDSKKADIRRDGVVSTSGGYLRCKAVVHVVLPHPKDGAAWRNTILKCLRKADDDGLMSLALPALGTGGLGLSAGGLAHHVFEAIEEFARGRVRSLVQVRVVLFQSRMLPAFIDALDAHSKGRHRWGKIDKSPAGDGSHSSSARREDSPEIGFHIFAMSQREIDAAIEKINASLAQEMIEKVIKDPIIKDLDPSQLAKIDQLTRNNQAKVDINSRIGSIRVTGMVTDVMDITQDIQNMLRDIERTFVYDREARFLADYVSWNYIDVTVNGQKMKAYEGKVNVELERAYKDNKDQVTFQDMTGRAYTVDFKAMEEFPVSDPTDRVKVIRKDMVKQTPSSASGGGGMLPAHWSHMADNENLKVVRLSQQAKEYQDVEQSFISSGGSANVIKIERVQNRGLYQQYMTKKRLIEQQNPHIKKNERTLWHGTSQDATDSINLYGFNRSYCGKNATAFGDGVYFACNASYSCSPTYARPDPQGNQRVYQSRVLTGEYTSGKHGLRVPPTKDPQKHILYDCVTGGGASIFVIFHDTQAYPEYLITFGNGSMNSPKGNMNSPTPTKVPGVRIGRQTFSLGSILRP